MLGRMCGGYAEKLCNIVRFKAEDSEMVVRLNDSSGFQLQFLDSVVACDVSYSREEYQTIWESKEVGCAMEIVANYFRRVICKAMNLKDLSVTSVFPKDSRRFHGLYERISVIHCKKLENLDIVKSCGTDLIGCGFLNPEHVMYNISRKIRVKGASLKLSELQNLKGQHMYIGSLKISSKDISQYLKLFVRGNLHENIETLNMHFMEGYSLDKEQVVDGLNVIGRTEEFGETLFALVSNVNPIRIGIVSFGGVWFEMRFLSKMQFDESEYIFQKYGFMIDESLKSL